MKWPDWPWRKDGKAEAKSEMSAESKATINRKDIKLKTPEGTFQDRSWTVDVSVKVVIAAVVTAGALAFAYDYYTRLTGH